MKIAIWGVGRLGSVVAFHIANEIQPEEIILDDCKNLRGDLLDLRQAIDANKKKTKITIISPYPKDVDITVLCAGQARLNSESKHIFEPNLLISTNYINSMYDHCNRYIVLTNPSDEITSALSDTFPDKEFYNIEEELRIMRGESNVQTILNTKGYTNFAPAVATVNLIKRLI